MELHYFSVADEHLDYYKFVVEGDRMIAEKHLHTLSKDVRFIQTKTEDDPYAKVHKPWPNGLILRQCVFTHQLRSKKSVGFNDNILPPDSRHEVFQEEGVA